MHITFVQTEFGWQLVEEGVPQTLGQADAAAGLVLQHAVDQIEESQMLRVVHHDVAVQWLAVFFYISCSGTFFVPIQSAVGEVLCPACQMQQQ